MPLLITDNPTWDDMAVSYGDAESPHLWPSQAWSPCLGIPYGITLHNLPGNSHGSFTANANPFWVWEEGRAALKCDGSVGHVSIPNQPLLSSVTKFTLACYIKRVSTTYGAFIGQGSTAAARVILQVWNDGILYFSIGASDYVYFTQSDLNWHSVIVVYDGAKPSTSRIKMYLDGSPQAVTINGTIPSSTPASSANFLIGYDSVNAISSSSWFDDILLYPRDLSDGEVLQLVNLGRGGWARRKRPAWYNTLLIPSAPPTTAEPFYADIVG